MKYLDENGLTKLWQKIKALIPTKTSQLTNDSNFVSTESDPTVPSHVKSITEADINKWNIGGSVTGDTLPIGAVIDYDGDTIPSNWEEVEDTGKTILYENKTGTTGTVTLSESVGNFSYLDIFYVDVDHGKSNSKRIDLGLSTSFVLDGMSYESQVSINYTTNYVANGTSISASSYGAFSRSYSTGVIAGNIDKNYVKILKVIGYKEA